MNNKWIGYGAVISAAAMWGIGGAVAKFLFNQAINPLVLVKIRLTLSFLLLAGGIFLYDRRLLAIPVRAIPYFAVMGIFGMAMLQIAFYMTISLTNVATAVFLQYLSPVIMALYAGLWEKEALGRYRILAVTIAAAGGFCIMLGSGRSEGLNFLGIFVGIIAACFMAFSTIYGRRGAREFNPLTTTAYMFGFGALACWIVMPFALPVDTGTPEQLFGLAYIVIFSTVLPFLLYFLAVRFLSPTNVGVTACLEPVVASVAAYLALSEVMSILQILGGAMVITAVILIQASSLQM